MDLKIPKYLEKVRDVTLTKDELIQFELDVKEVYETGEITAPIHGMDRDILFEDIKDGRSMCINSMEPKFYTSSIVGGNIPIALGVAKALKMNNSGKRVWCFIGDMTFETGVFYESYKYAKNFDLPIQFVVEDNNMSTNTPTDETWGKKKEVPDDVIYYSYDRAYPHHGTGNWVLF